MKKYYMSVIIGLAVFLLAACGDSATPTDGTTAKSDLTLEQVFNNAMARQESLQSVKANMAMEQEMAMTIDGEEGQMTSSSNIEMSMTAKPLALFVDGTIIMTMGGDEETFNMPISMYLTEADGLYMNDMMSGGWVKLPSDMYEELLGQMGANADAQEQLKQLESFLEDFKFEQTDGEYILTLNANGEKFNEMIFEQVSGSLGQQLGEEDYSAFDGIKIKDAKYVITVDKETFDITKIVMDFIMTIDIEGVLADVNTSSTITYSNFDAVDTITIPQDVLNTAIDSDF